MNNKISLCISGFNFGKRPNKRMGKYCLLTIAFLRNSEKFVSPNFQSIRSSYSFSNKTFRDYTIKLNYARNTSNKSPQHFLMTFFNQTELKRDDNSLIPNLNSSKSADFRFFTRTSSLSHSAYTIKRDKRTYYQSFI